MKLFRTIETIPDGNYCVGDIIAFTLNDGEKVEALAVKQEQDGMIFILKDCFNKEYSMNNTNSNCGGYKSCSLRNVLNTEILDLFPMEIREKMFAFKNGDLLRLPTEREIFGYNPYSEKEPENVERWEPMKDQRNRIAFKGSKTGKWEWYWLQNRVYGSDTDFVSVISGGGVDYRYAVATLGVRPVFKI